MSAELVWLNTRRSNRWLVKSFNELWSKDDLNLTNRHNFQDSGYSQPFAFSFTKDAEVHEKHKVHKFHVYSKDLKTSAKKHVFLYSMAGSRPKKLAQGLSKYRPELLNNALLRLKKLHDCKKVSNKEISKKGQAKK